MGRGPGTGGLPVEAFVALVEQEGAAIHAYLARRAPRAAEDLLARVWLEAFAARTTYDPELGAPRVWLFGVARHVLHRHWRDLARQPHERGSATDPDLVEDPWDEVDRRLDAAELAGPLRDALDDLPAVDREMLLLVAWEQLTPTEAAAVVGIPPATARTRLHRARARMRCALDDCDRPVPLSGGPR
jgi:RNA polymerase sigma-70 factor (ECF subfamily)